MTKAMLKITKWIATILSVLLMVFLIAIIGLLFTNAGLNVLLWGAQQAVPQLQVATTQGALFPRFTLNQVAFIDDDLHLDLKAKRVTLAVNANCLFEPALCVQELAVIGLDFAMPELPPESDETQVVESEPVTAISTPVPITIGRVVLNDIKLDILGNKIAWQSFSSNASMFGNRLKIGKTSWNDIQLSLAPNEAESAMPTAAESERQPIVLPDVTIPLQVELMRFDINNFTLQQAEPIVVNHLGLVANAYQHNVSLKALELDLPLLVANLKADVRLQGEYPLNLSLKSTIKQAEANGQTVALDAFGSVNDLTLDAKFGGLAQATLHAQLSPLDPELPFDIVLDDVQAQWPLIGQGDYFISVPTLKTQGSLQGYNLTLQTQLKGKDLPDVSLDVAGKGTLEQIALESLLVETLGGSVRGQAMANWQAPINWQAALTMQDIQPGLQWSEAEGVISGKLETSGELTSQGGWKVALPLLDIDGTLRDYPLNIEGQLDASDPTGNGEFQVSTSGLTLAHGPNQITAKGVLDKNWRMGLSVDFPDLAKSVPDLAGKLIGDIQLGGDLKQPKIKLRLDADSLAWQKEATLQHVTLQGDVIPLPTPQAKIRLQARQLEYQQHSVESLDLNFAGTQQQHTLSLDMVSDLLSTSLAISGAFEDKPAMIWKGALDSVQFSTQQGPWELNQVTPIVVNVDKQQATIAAHCWLQNDSSLCLDKEATVGQNGAAQLSINQFDFKQISMFVPAETEIQGQADANITAKWAENSTPQAQATLNLSKGHVTQHLEHPVTLGWESVSLETNLDQNKLLAQWLLDVTDNGDISGQLTVPNVIAKDKTIDGTLKLSTFNLDFLKPIIGEYSQVKSNITTDLTFNGPMLHPKVIGSLVVDEMLIKGDISPVDVNSGRLAVDFNGYQAALNAAIQTPDGELDLVGDADWQRLEDWHANLRVFAEELMVDLPPMVKIKVVPDMTINVKPTLAKITGNINLPWGRILVEELPSSAVSVSKDQVILDASLQPIDDFNAIPFNIETDINISIGDDFKLNAFGLQGGLIGRLNVAQKDKGPFITGEINIKDGSYRSFGQDLVIEEGKILMNGPADQPYVSIKAIRNPDNTADDVIAGVKVTGPADEPEVSIFSEPAMPQANALSYLLRGQDIDGEAGGNAMTTALIGLSLAKSGRVVGEIGQAFGVQDLQLDTAGTGDDSQVTVSGYILPGLQVKYGVGIFSSVGEFTVRYRLMQDLYLEAVSGLDSAVDILYQFEFD
ncbi:translocation/assembly module TamB domain-containing protein [Vibrio aestuarianus]|uniref:autotransporter assembly complex protein TamB n=1 Tax=Vibrio aestuarianus TaxID=28171 RepID=UPI00237CB92B|nr:translocation/assembly module TamB domain-containing protein [Vibrio aestuarianus]MDE1231089.1 translocation/assembly module TamB [Vibrio aestuarianus]